MGCAVDGLDPPTGRLYSGHNKSSLQPAQRLEHLGLLLDTGTSTLSLLKERQVKHLNLLNLILKERLSDVMLLTRLMGMLVSCLHIVKWVHLHAWWQDKQRLSEGSPFGNQDWVMVMTDASLLGWGAHTDGVLAQGTWTETERTAHINLLELRTIRLALLKFTHLLQGH